MFFDIDTVMQAVEADNNIGVCRECNETQENVEPDAENYNCDFCGKNAVCGAEILLMEI